jgi:peptide/nickel transport system ATP-binding protein
VVIGDLEGLEELATEARVEAGRGHSGADVREVLGELRRESPDDPFWTGVREIETGEDDVVVRFHEPLQPRPVDAGSSEVLCHLHDEAALARAGEARDASRPGR